MNNKHKQILDLLNQIQTEDNQPYFSTEYIEKTFLGIKTCQICKTKDFYKEDICPQCKRDNNINQILQ
jgi:hypothetical protein